MKILLVTCIALALAAAEPRMQKKSHLRSNEGRTVNQNTPQVQQELKQGTFDSLRYQALIQKLYNTLCYLSYCPYELHHARASINKPTKISKQKQSKQRKHKGAMATKQSDSEDELAQELIQTYEAVSGGFNNWFVQVLGEGTPDSVKETTITSMLDVLVNWQNQTITTVDFDKRRAIRQGIPGGPYPSFFSGMCEFLFVLLDYFDYCEGRENECLVQLSQILFEEQIKGLGKMRYGSDHDYLLEAVKDLADRLEEAGNPEDHAIFLLAKAVIHLFEDIEILMNKPKVVTNVSVFLDVYNVLELVDNCAQDQQCWEDSYKALSQMYPH